MKEQIAMKVYKRSSCGGGLDGRGYLDVFVWFAQNWPILKLGRNLRRIRAGRNYNGAPALIIQSGRAIIISSGSDASEVPAEFQDWPVLRKPYKDIEISSAIKSAAATRSLINLHRNLLLHPV